MPNAVPLNAEYNTTHVRLYLKDEDQTHQLTIVQADQTSTVKTVHVRKFFLVPNGFKIANLLSK